MTIERNRRSRPFLLLACLLAAVAGCHSPSHTPTPPSSDPARTTTVDGAGVLQPGGNDPRISAGAIARQSGDYEHALALFREVLKENPMAASAYLGIGEVYRDQGNYGKAEPAFAQAARIEPRNFDAQFGHGLVLQLLKRFVEAIAAYQRALTIQPDNFEANRNMATVYLQLDNPRSGVLYAQKAVVLRADDGPSHVNLGVCYEKMDRYTEAIREYETAMELMDPPSQELLTNLVNAYGHEKRFEEAANAALVLVRIAPTANSYERLGWSWFRLGQYENSIEAYRAGVKIDPDHWPSLNGVGVNALNRWLLSTRRDNAAAEEARRAFQHSLQVNANQPKVVELLSAYRL